MNRILLGFGVLSGIAVASVVTEAEPVQTGAMDICKLIDGGETSIENTDAGPAESCCATERLGDETYGREYCVVCIVGTNSCYRSYVTRNREQSVRELKKVLATRTKKAPVTGN
jgi:hypothetical protein